MQGIYVLFEKAKFAKFWQKKKMMLAELKGFVT